MLENAIWDKVLDKYPEVEDGGKQYRMKQGKYRVQLEQSIGSELKEKFRKELRARYAEQFRRELDSLKRGDERELRDSEYSDMDSFIDDESISEGSIDSDAFQRELEHKERVRKRKLVHNAVKIRNVKDFLEDADSEAKYEDTEDSIVAEVARYVKKAERHCAKGLRDDNSDHGHPDTDKVDKEEEAEEDKEEEEEAEEEEVVIAHAQSDSDEAVETGRRDVWPAGKPDPVTTLDSADDEVDLIENPEEPELTALDEQQLMEHDSEAAREDQLSCRVYS